MANKYSYIKIVTLNLNIWFHFSSNRRLILIFSLKGAARATQTSIYIKWECANSNTTVHLICSTHIVYQFFFFPTVHRFVCAFLYFLLNIYKCMYSYTDLTNSYNIFTIIDNLHCLSTFFFFFFHNKSILLVFFLSFLLNIICAYTVTLTQQFLTIFSQLLRCQFFKGQNKIIK